MKKREIVFVTSNRGKIASAKKELKNIIEVIPFHAELTEPRSDDIRKIAKAKALEAYNITKKPCIAMDTGFFIDELNGFPRAYVNPVLETIGIEGIMKLMDGVKNRNCEFRECIAYYDGDEINFFECVIPCTISKEIRENKCEESWSKLWYIVIPCGFNKVLAEFNDEDRNKFDSQKNISSIKIFGEWFLKQ
jgi:XTP/dITP diphosphohydrolase